MTHLNNATIETYRKYPALAEMEKLYPEGIPEQLRTELMKRSYQWDNLLRFVHNQTRNWNLRNSKGETATLDPSSARLQILKSNGRIFEANYENRVTALYEAFESGFTEMH